jgi:hypothetical protein
LRTAITQVNDGKASMRKSDRLITGLPYSETIRASIGHGIPHRNQGLSVDRTARVSVNPDDSTHRFRSPTDTGAFGQGAR